MKRSFPPPAGANKRPPPAEPPPDGAAAAALRLQAAWRGFRLRATGLAPHARAAAAAAASMATSRTSARLAERVRSAEYRQIGRCCKLADIRRLAQVDLELEALVGLGAVKEYCAQLRRDLVARAALGDEPLLRNVLLSGNLGTGKKLAARLLCAMARALGAARGATTTETTLEQLVLDVRRDVSCVVVSELSGAENVKAKVNAVLSNFPRHMFVFLGPTHEVEALHGAVTYFRKAEPAWLQLPPYPADELAAITEQQICEAGYRLEEGFTRREVRQAICSTWSRDVLSMRNAHLPHELVQRAISNRNSRLSLKELLHAPLVLRGADFGLEPQGLDSLLAERQATNAEVKQLIGMAPLKEFLKELEAKVMYVQAGGDPRLLEGCLNVVLTGNPGAGKTTAARLLFRSLRAYGLLRKNVFVERNALELKGTHIGWTCPQVKEMVQAALGGCLFLDEAYALSGGGKDGDRGDSFSDEALRTLLTETENNRSSLCVVLAGYRDGMAHLMRADPGLVRRFPTTLHLDDYSPAELACIARQTAAARYGLSFAPGLEAALAAHIGTAHAAEIPKHNASLAVQLVEAAMNRLAARLVASAAASPADQRTLLPSDFAISPSSSADDALAAAEAAIAALPSQLSPAKAHLLALRDRLRFVAAGGAEEALRGATRLVLCGGEGTDADAVVRALSLLLAAHGVSRGACVCRSALGLAGESAAAIYAKLEDMLDAAAGGMFVLRDVGALVQCAAASRALGVAVAGLPARTAVVLVGLPQETAELMKAAPALAACFPPRVVLPDLTPAEVARLVASRAVSTFSLSLAAGVEEQLAAQLSFEASRRTKARLEELSFRNGALADSLLQRAVGRLASRAAAGRALRTELTSADFGLCGESSSPGSSPISVP